MKRCTKCSQMKPLSEFYMDRRAQDNHRSECKVCTAAYQRLYQQTDGGLAADRAAGRRYRQTSRGREVRRAAERRRWRSEKVQAIKRRYWRSEKGKDVQRKAQRRYRERNPEKVKAGCAVGTAIRAGRMFPAAAFGCCNCDKPAEEYHHPNYVQVLVVVPLCKRCHRALHRKIG